MHIISRKRLKEFWEGYPDAKVTLESWFKTAKKAKWQNITEVRQTYSHADAVGTCTVFNIGGTKYRLITKIEYRFQSIYIKQALTHAEYDQEEWKYGCGSKRDKSKQVRQATRKNASRRH
jgi:mRNA interferase HigB